MHIAADTAVFVGVEYAVNVGPVVAHQIDQVLRLAGHMQVVRLRLSLLTQVLQYMSHEMDQFPLEPALVEEENTLYHMHHRKLEQSELKMKLFP